MIVAQARSPSFYRGYGVPDTVSGRFDMIVLHLVLVLRRLRDAPANVARLVNKSLTGSAATWTTISGKWEWATWPFPKRCGASAEAFYGRAGAYEAALADAEPAALESGAGAQCVRDRAAAARCAASRRLYARGGAAPCRAGSGAGELRFPDPDQVAAVTIDKAQDR